VHKHLKFTLFKITIPQKMHLFALLFLEFKKLLHLEIFSEHVRMLKLHFFITNQDETAFWGFLGYLFL